MDILIWFGLLVFWLTTVGICDARDKYYREKELQQKHLDKDYNDYEEEDDET